jgi:hypothetical protein
MELQMGAFSDLDKKIEEGKEKVKEGAEKTRERIRDWSDTE